MLINHFDPPEVIPKTYLVGLFMPCFLALYYFYNALKNDALQVFNRATTYFSIGMLLFLTTSFPLLAFMDVLITNYTVHTA